MPDTGKDALGTSFGLAIAYLLPGMSGLYGFTFWFPGMRKSFVSFQTSASNVGVFLLVLMLGLTVGLILNSVRWAIFEAWRPDQLKTEELATLTLDRQRLAAYRARLEDDFRFHQFNGNSVLAMLILYSGSLKTSWVNMKVTQILEQSVLVVVLGLVFVFAALDRYKRFIDGTRRVLQKWS